MFVQRFVFVSPDYSRINIQVPDKVVNESFVMTKNMQKVQIPEKTFEQLEIGSNRYSQKGADKKTDAYS